MLYMVIESFKEGAAPEIYRRFREKGRMMPPGVEYVSSWISHDLTMCWQVMQTENPALLKQWARCWDDLIIFEIVPVLTSADAQASLSTE
jgi:uncharacterized protein DUF3303